ncbi:MAG: hypothetical protein ACI4TI_03720 [Christensenellales bacterium]
MAEENDLPESKEVAGKNKKPTKKKKILIYSLRFIIFGVFAAIAIAGGFVVGDLLIGQWDTFDPTQFSADSYKESSSNIAQWKTKNVSELSPTQVFVVAEANILDCDRYCMKTKGYDGEDKGYVITLGVRQDLYGYRYRNGDKGYFDYFSTGMATVVKKTEFSYSDFNCYTYNGAISGNSVDWTLFKTEQGNDFWTKEEYKALTGCYAESPIDYIVSTKTVVEEKSNGKVGDFYSYTLKLNTETAVLNYVVKMNYMSGFGFPKFSSIELRFEVDENMNFQNIYINESYKVIGMNANSKYKAEFSYKEIETR